MEKYMNNRFKIFNDKSYKIENLLSKRRLLSTLYFLLSMFTFLLSTQSAYAQPQLITTPDTLAFGDVPINSSSTQNITIQNSGTADLIISQVAINGTGFTLQNAETPITLTSGGSRTMAVQFSPTVATSYSGSVTLTHNASGSASTVQLTGRGVQPSITIIDFGDVLVSTSSTKTFRMTNYGNADLIISSMNITGTDANLFTFTSTTPITVLPSQSHDITVRFLPNGVGVKNAELNINHNDNASGSLSTVQLTGRGVISDITPVRVAILNNYIVKPNETVKVSIQAMEDLSEKNVKSFSFVLRYNKRILNVRDVSLINTMSNMLSVSIGGSTPGELFIRVTNTTGEPLTGIGSLIDINFIGLRGDTCGTQLILESFEFNSDGPPTTIENGYCELFGRCGEEPPYVTTDRSTRVYQNNPNPIQEGYESTIQYRINVAGETNLIVYDILGREVAKLVNEYKSEGTYSVTFNTKGLPSGVYFYRLRAPGYEGLKKMVIVR